MQKNPLKFFIELAEPVVIDSLLEEFYFEAEDNTVDAPFDKTEQWIMVSYAIDEHQKGFRKLSFGKYLAGKLLMEKLDAIEQLDLYLGQEDSIKRSQNALAAFISTLETQLHIVRKDKTLKRYAEVQENYEALLSYLHNKAHALGLITNRKSEPSSEKTHKKLMWLDDIKTLTTFIYDLYERKLNKGEPYIKAKSKDDVIYFVINNFNDKNGNELSYDTIKNYLKPGRLSARANVDKAINLDKLLKG